MTKKKNNPNITKIKRRFGAFEVRLSDAKIEIEDYIHKQVKFVYGNQTQIYQMFSYLLNDGYLEENGDFAEKTNEAKVNDLKEAERYLYIIVSTVQIFSNKDLFAHYFKGLELLLGFKEYKEPEGETDDEILESEKAKFEAEKILKDSELRDTFLEAGLEY